MGERPVGSAGSPACEELAGIAERIVGWARDGEEVEACVARRAWGILTFHGIHEGHLSVAESDFRELVNYLKGNHQRIWTAPVAKVARRILDWRKQNGI